MNMARIYVQLSGAKWPLPKACTKHDTTPNCHEHILAVMRDRVAGRAKGQGQAQGQGHMGKGLVAVTVAM